MRTVKFRGYNIKNKQWIYGYYLVNRGKHYIVQDGVVEPFKEASDFEVDAESVGQCTDVEDKNGVIVYEGDIMNTCDGINKVVWRNGIFGFHPYDPLLFFPCYLKEYEVISNEYEQSKVVSFEELQKECIDSIRKVHLESALFDIQNKKK